MSIVKLILGFIACFTVLSIISITFPVAMILMVFVVPAFGYQIGKCRCKCCGSEFGMFLENLD